MNPVETKTYNFVLVLCGVSAIDDRIEDALFEAGCDDATLAFRNGVAYLEFDREADSLESAILSAVRGVEQSEHDISVSHVEPDDVVTASEIARRLERSREYVRLLALGTRGKGGFPSPSSGVTGTKFLWSWASVVSWLVTSKNLTDKSLLTHAETIRDINDVLSLRSHPSILKRQHEILRKLESRQRAK